MENLTDSWDLFPGDQLELVISHIILETINSVILLVGTYFVYIGIEINHPIYAIIFCDFIGSLVTSLFSAAILPLSLSHIRYTPMAHTSSVICLDFHCCCWCVLSALRYLYVIHKDWIEEKFPDVKVLVWYSLGVLGVLFTFNATTMITTALHFGYPHVRVMDMPLESKLVCLTVIVMNLILMILASCWFNYQILRQRGRVGQSRVGVAANQEPVSDLFFIENANPELQDQEIFAKIQDETLLQKHQAEVRSAMVSLKTNLFYILVLVFILCVLIFDTKFANNILTILFLLLKSQVSIISSVINFLKIRSLLAQSYGLLSDWLSKFNPQA